MAGSGARSACFTLALAVSALATPSLAAADPQTLASGRVAVLDFRGVKRQYREEAAYLSEQVRVQVKKAVPTLQVITKENIVTILTGSGKTLEDCEGQCEVDTGRLLGVDLVVTGELVNLGKIFRVTLKLYETMGGSLLNGSDPIKGATIDELETAVLAAVPLLLAPLKATPKSAPQLSLGKQQQLPDVPELQAGPTGLTAGDVDVDVLVAYDAAVKADATGKDNPEAAAKAWKALAETPGKNPYKKQAQDREKQWAALDAQKRAFEAQFKLDTEQMRKVLPLSTVGEPLRIDMLLRYARIYGPVHAQPLVALIDSAQGRARVQQALECEAKDAAKCLAVGKAREDQKDFGGAVPWYEKACDAGGAEGCEKVGLLYLDGALPRDSARALAALEKACSARRPAACRRVAVVYENGDGVKVDLARALTLHDKACDTGDGESCARLAVAYASGSGVSVDAQRARSLYQRGCERGSSQACAWMAETQRKEDALRAEAQRKAEAEKADRLRREYQQAADRKARAVRSESLKGRRKVAWVLIAGGALAGGGAAFFAQQGAAQNDKLLTGSFATRAQMEDVLSAGRTHNLLAKILGGVALGGVAIGVPLLIFSREPADAPRASLAPLPGGGGALVLAGALP